MALQGTARPSILVTPLRRIAHRQGPRSPVSSGAMKSRARIMIFVLLAAFALSTVSHAASTTAMSVKMAVGEATNMADCKGCGSNEGDDTSSTCDVACVTPLVATMNADKQLLSPSRRHSSDGRDYGFIGRTGPPDPHPPRSFILN